MKAIVKSPLHHDNRIYAIGSEVDLTDEQATSLAEIGVVKIASTIVNKGDEAVSSQEAAQDSGAAQEEATKVVKKSGKGAVVNE